MLSGGIVIYQMFLGGGILEVGNGAPDLKNPFLWMAVGQVAAAAVIRWLVIPRFLKFQQILTWAILGLALSEAVEFYGIFLIDHDNATKMTFFGMSLLSALQFIPVYAKNMVVGVGVRSER